MPVCSVGAPVVSGVALVLNAQHVPSGACDLFVKLFHGLYCSGSMSVGVAFWFGWGGVVSVCRLRHSVDGYINIRNMLSIK